ncbi:hypothetical protein P9112_002726 [Eukaryota sp. TZLM1-RC]
MKDSSLESTLLINSDVDVVKSKVQQKNALSTFSGVFCPTILCMFSVIVFLRLGWVLGQSGFIQALAITFLGGLITFLTLLSISSIATNGPLKGGGAFYLISRSLGPEFGGSIGLLFYLANAFSCILSTIGFTDTLLHDYPSLNFVNTGQPENDLFWTKFIISSITLIALTSITLIGADVFSKTTCAIFIYVSAALLCVIFSIFYIKPFSSEGFTGLCIDTFKSNLYSSYTPIDPSNPTLKYSFTAVFVINFPALTGIMAGVNMSGDLATPRSIPRGAFTAFFTALFTYTLLYILLAGSTTRQILQENYFILQQLSVSHFLVSSAAYAVLLGSALSSLVGAGRVLQALARDDLLPVLSPFKKGSKDKDEPRVATCLTFVLLQIVLFFGSVDLVAKIDSNFFLLSYAIVNLACFTLRISGAPNFRPSFRYFHWSVGLLGVIGCLIVMALSSPMYATVSLCLLLLVFFYIHFKAPVRLFNECNGDISQALLFHTVRKYLLRLDSKTVHTKYWRPSILAIFRDPDCRASVNVVKFINQLKKGGLFIFSSVLKGHSSEVERIIDKKDELTNIITSSGVKAFPMVNAGQDFRSLVTQLVLLSGLGQLKPNSVFIYFFDEYDSHWNLGESGFVDVASDILLHKKNLLLARNFGTFDTEILAKQPTKLVIDVWPFLDLNGDSDVKTVHLSLLYAFVLSRSSFWKGRTNIRLLSIAERSDLHNVEEFMNELLAVTRIEAEVIIDNAEDKNLNTLIKKYSRSSDISFIAINQPNHNDWLEVLTELTNEVGPTVMVRGNGDDVVSASL